MLSEMLCAVACTVFRRTLEERGQHWKVRRERWREEAFEFGVVVAMEEGCLF